MKIKGTDKPGRITFLITTSHPLPTGEQIFISGSENTLGNWAADGFPLSRIQDNAWSGTAILPSNKNIEYKITRGSWETEEVLDTNIIPPNRILPKGGDCTVELTVSRWRDSRLPPAPLITGDYKIHKAVKSKHLTLPRDVIVWLPPSYAGSSKSYPVLYMQDGQQVFDPNTSTWNQAWDVDDSCTTLIEKKKIKEIIVVAIYSTAHREDEYTPTLDGEKYGMFVVKELKPFIDKSYRTKPGKESTAIAGASMGGSIAFFIAWTHPDVFFGAACLSPAFQYKGKETCLDLVRDSLVVPDIRFYLYCGNGDSLEKTLMPGLRDMARLLRQAGYKDKKNLLVIEKVQAVHKEEAWAAQTDRWLQFLFENPSRTNSKHNRHQKPVT